MIGSGHGLQQLSSMSSCTCLGYETTYECTVFSGVVTIWFGTAFHNCSHDRILLRHSDFSRNDTYSLNTICGAIGTMITGRVVSVVNNSYTSQLTVYVSQDLVGKTIACANGNENNIVGTAEINLTTGKYYNLSI